MSHKLTRTIYRKQHKYINIVFSSVIMTKLNPEPMKHTAFSIPYSLYIRYRALRPRENLSGKITSWVFDYVEELEKR